MCEEGKDNFQNNCRDYEVNVVDKVTKPQSIIDLEKSILERINSQLRDFQSKIK